MKKERAEIRFWRLAETGHKSTCWNWIGSLDPDGYGCFWVDKKLIKAHRFSLEFAKGKILPGLTIDHLCKNRRCVNPSHMQLVTLKDNILRGESPAAKAARRTCCSAGHEYVEGSFSLTTKRNGKSFPRRCKLCRRLRYKLACERKLAMAKPESWKAGIRDYPRL